MEQFIKVTLSDKDKNGKPIRELVNVQAIRAVEEEDGKAFIHRLNDLSLEMAARKDAQTA